MKTKPTLIEILSAVFNFLILASMAVTIMLALSERWGGELESGIALFVALLGRGVVYTIEFRRRKQLKEFIKAMGSFRTPRNTEEDD